VNSGILRILDANFNRAREAMRVLEDYSRFILNDDRTSVAIKQLRHDFKDATSHIAPSAILHRDTPGDVGVGSKVTGELTRENVAHVVTAAGKRLGEALRTIEEYLKTLDPAAAAKIETIRYRAYELEQSLAFTLRPAARGVAGVKLCILLTESVCRQPWLKVAEAAINGGADCIQLREKLLDGAELLWRARQLVELCHRRSVRCIINDRPDIAILCGGDGVHVGQEDLPAREARKLIGSERILGVSTHSIEQARQAVLDGADYIGVGPVFRSSTKPRDFLPGLDYARQVAGEISIPGVAVAGITLENVDEVMATGIRAVAVSSAVIETQDPESAARSIKCRLLQSENGCPKT
jgi:thiamine-phosphate pyrophosphorylase